MVHSTLLLLLSACVGMSSNMHMVYSNACMRHRCDRQVNKHFVWLNKILNYIHRTFTHCNLSEQFCKIVSCFLKDTIDITVPRYPTNIYAVCSANQKASRRFLSRAQRPVHIWNRKLNLAHCLEFWGYQIFEISHLSTTSYTAEPP